jgi:hypothetical protein
VLLVSEVRQVRRPRLHFYLPKEMIVVEADTFDVIIHVFVLIAYHFLSYITKNLKSCFPQKRGIQANKN